MVRQTGDYWETSNGKVFRDKESAEYSEELTNKYKDFIKQLENLGFEKKEATKIYLNKFEIYKLINALLGK